MRACLFILPLTLLTGCLTASITPVSYWVVKRANVQALSTTQKYGAVRVSQVSVRSPYDSRQLVVRRPDGSLAFDAYNQFAALPSQVFKAPVISALSDSGLCKVAVDASSSARVDHIAEVVVTDLAIVSSGDNQLSASVAVLIRMLDAKRDVVSVSIGSGEVPVRDGLYTDAFSEAFSSAVGKMLAGL